MEDFEVDELVALIPNSSSKLNPKIFTNTYTDRFSNICKKSIDLGNNTRKYTDLLRREIDSNFLPERNGTGNIKLLKIYILNESNLQDLLRTKFELKINNFKDQILEYFTKEFLIEYPPRKAKKSQITKFSKKLTPKFIFDQVKSELLKWFDNSGIFNMDVELIFNDRFGITDTSPRDQIYSHFMDLLIEIK